MQHPIEDATDARRGKYAHILLRYEICIRTRNWVKGQVYGLRKGAEMGVFRGTRNTFMGYARIWAESPDKLFFAPIICSDGPKICLALQNLCVGNVEIHSIAASIIDLKSDSLPPPNLTLTRQILLSNKRLWQCIHSAISRF